MYMEVFHIYGSFPCIWKFSMFMESLFMYMEVLHHVYGSSLCIRRVFSCIWKKYFFYFRMEFPEFGMICPVQGCPTSSFYRKFDQLKRHWYNIHVQEITMHQCSYCRKDFLEKRHAKSHVKTHRTPAGLPISITDFKKRNNLYRSPGPATLPRQGSTPTRSAVTNLSFREQAADRQRRLADACQQTQSAQLSETGAWIVTRDQEVRQWANGSTVRQPKKHWRGSGDDVVELDYKDDL